MQNQRLAELCCWFTAFTMLSQTSVLVKNWEKAKVKKFVNSQFPFCLRGTQESRGNETTKNMKTLLVRAPKKKGFWLFERKKWVQNQNRGSTGISNFLVAAYKCCFCNQKQKPKGFWKAKVEFKKDFRSLAKWCGAILTVLTFEISSCFDSQKIKFKCDFAFKIRR